MKNIVLVVDDSPETIGMLNAVLDDAGMMVLVALEGQQALSIAQNMKPDIILLDAMMPGMSGFEVCQTLKKDAELHTIPVIFMTGLSDTEHVVEGFEMGGVDYITKPINTTELLARMQVHLKNARHAIDAQLALDEAGHFILCVNSQGMITWSTDYVNKLIASTPDDKDWQHQELQPVLKAWLDHQPSLNDALSINTSTRQLRISLQAKTQNGEYLLKVMDTDTANEISLLRSKLELTGREAEVLLWISKAKTNREIAQILEASPRTINKHSENIYKKLGVDNRTAAASKALNILD